MGAGSSKKKHPTHDKTKVGWTSDEYDKIHDEYTAAVDAQLRQFNRDHPQPFMMPGAMMDGRGAPMHGLPIGFSGSGDSLRDAGIKKIKDDVYRKYKPLLDAAPHGNAFEDALDIPLIPENVANVLDMVPLVNVAVREARAASLAKDGDGDAVAAELNLAIGNGALDVVTGGVGSAVKGVNSVVKAGTKVGTKATKLVRGGISGSKLVTMGAAKSVVKVAAEGAEHLAANEANKAALKAGIAEAEAAAAKAEKAVLEKSLPKVTSKKSLFTAKNAGIASIAGAGAGLVPGLVPYVTGVVDNALKPKDEKDTDDWRAKFDPLYGPLSTYCKGSMILMFQDKKSCGFLKFASPVILGAGILALLPKDIASSKRIVAALGVSSGYYVIKEDVFHIFVNVPEDEKDNGPTQSVDDVDAGDILIER